MSPTATAATVVTDGGSASASNPPLQITLWKADGAGGWTQVTDLGGGGVKTVAGKAPDVNGAVALTHADLGPIQVGDLGFDPETQAEYDAGLLTINGSIKSALQEMRARAAAASPLLWFDDFERSTLNPSPALIGGNYALSDQSGAASISSGRYVSSGNSYLARTFPGRRVVGYGGEFSVTDSRPSLSGPGAGALILVKESTFDPTTSSFLHFTFSHNGYYATIWTPGNANTPLESGDSYVAPPAPLATDGTKHVFTVSINGSELTVRFGGATYTHTDSRLPTIFGTPGAGPTVVWQATDDSTANRYRLGWDSATVIGAQGATRYDLALKRDISDSYSKAATDAAIAAASGKLAPYDPAKTYAVDDVAVSPAGDLVRATAAQAPGAALSYIGGSSGLAGTSLALPAGAQAGDLAITINGASNGAAVPSGFTKLTDTAYSASYWGTGTISTKTLTTGDITLGNVPVTGQGTFLLRVYRNAGAPQVDSTVASSGSIAAGSPVPFPAQDVASGSIALRVFAGRSTGGTMASGATFASPAVNVQSLFQGPDPSTVVAAAEVAAGAARTIPAGFADGTSPQQSAYLARFEIEIPTAVGYNPAQWTKLVDTSSLKPKRVAVADANYTADGTETVIAYTTLTAARTVSLPAASAFTAGRFLTVKNDSGSGFQIVLARAGSDTIDGATSTPLSSTAPTGSLTIVSDGVSKWSIVRDAGVIAALAAKLDTTAGAVGLTNLATAATPALTIGPGSGGNGATVAAGTSAFSFVVTANTDVVTLPSVSAHGEGRLLLVTTVNSGLAVPTFTGTLNRAGTNTIGQSGATSLAIPPAIGFVLLRSNGSSRWDIIAGAGIKPTWTAPTFGTNTAALSGTTPGASLDQGGYVHLRGALTAPSTATAANEVLATLPNGLRPAQTTRVPAYSSDVLYAGQLTINTDGTVTYYQAIGVGKYVTLDGISFPAA